MTISALTVCVYTFSVTSGALPNGLMINANTGTITGTPLGSGTSNFTITAVDANGCLGSRAYSITIAAIACPAIILGSPTLPPGMTGIAYSQTVTASGGVAPYTFVVASGALPTGLTINANTGAITGTPTTAGFFNFTIGASDANGCPGSTLGVSITIALAAPVVVPTLDLGGLAMLLLLLAGTGWFTRHRFAG